MPSLASLECSRTARPGVDGRLPAGRAYPTSAGVPPVIRTSSANELGKTVRE